MELASMLAGQRFSDQVPCVDPAIGAFLRGYQDHLSEELRQDLYHYATRVLDTRGDDELAAWRAELCRSWSDKVRSYDPRGLVLLRGTHLRVFWWLRFRRRGTLDLDDCELAGAYAASMARRDCAWHTLTLGFIGILCRAGSAESHDELTILEPPPAPVASTAPESAPALSLSA